MSKMKLIIPKDYDPVLNRVDTQIAIKVIKDTFERELAASLGLIRVSAPLFVPANSGLNDNLSGVERPVQFDLASTGEELQIVQSLAKWKRMALKKYGLTNGHGIYTDMNAIRRDEAMDNTHSIYVDQWDWEQVIGAEDRNLKYLKEIVRKIFDALWATQEMLCARFTNVRKRLAKEPAFITSQELEDMYPDISPEERENEITKQYGSVFVMQIGEKLRSGNKHGDRSPDYDDWSLNGDILVWDDVLERALEISSMGIRVDSKTLDYQLKAAGCDDRRELEFHKNLLADKYPLTIGGGIGQSRICMFLLGKAHVGEVQASHWPAEMIEECDKNGIKLL